MIPHMNGFTGLETLRLSLMTFLNAVSLKGLGAMPELIELDAQAEKEEINKPVCYHLMDWKHQPW